jgi:hypothetical protein
METTYEGFDFDKHILKLDKEKIKDRLKPQTVKRLWNKVVFKQSFEELVDDKYGDINTYYDQVKCFFDEMIEQRYCNIKYKVINNNFIFKSIEHKVEISGSEKETFNLNGTAKFYDIKDSKITIIPVEKSGDTFDIILFKHPQIEIPTTGLIKLDYNFNTEFSMGEQSKGFLGASSPFTDNPLLTYFFNTNTTEKFWYGKPGEIYYRYRDGFFQEIKKAVFGAQLMRFPRITSIDERTLEKMLDKNNKRDVFKMRGTLTLNGTDTPIYRGMIESSGAFPFFLWKDGYYCRIKKRQNPIPDDS